MGVIGGAEVKRRRELQAMGAITVEQQEEEEDNWEDSPNNDSGNEWEESPPSPTKRSLGQDRGYRETGRYREREDQRIVSAAERYENEHQAQVYYRDPRSSPNRGVKLSGMFEDPFKSLTSPNSASSPPRKRSPVAK